VCRVAGTHYSCERVLATPASRASNQAREQQRAQSRLIRAQSLPALCFQQQHRDEMADSGVSMQLAPCHQQCWWVCKVDASPSVLLPQFEANTKYARSLISASDSPVFSCGRCSSGASRSASSPAPAPLKPPPAVNEPPSVKLRALLLAADSVLQAERRAADDLLAAVSCRIGCTSCCCCYCC
jgi:hypothetical protein